MADADITETAKEQIRQQEVVRSALKQNPAEVGPPQVPVTAPRDKAWFVGYLLFFLGLGALHYLFALRVLGLSDSAVDWGQKFTKVGMLLTLLLGLARTSEVYLIG